MFAPPAIALAIGAYVNVQYPGIAPKWVGLRRLLRVHGTQHRRHDGSRPASSSSSRWSPSSSSSCSWAWVAPGFAMANFPQGRLGRPRRVRRDDGAARHLRRDPVRDLVLPGHRRRGDGRRGSEGAAPLGAHRLYRRHPHAGGARRRRDALRRRLGRLDEAGQHQRPVAAGDEARGRQLERLAAHAGVARPVRPRRLLPRHHHRLLAAALRPGAGGLSAGGAGPRAPQARDAAHRHPRRRRDRHRRHLQRRARRLRRPVAHGQHRDDVGIRRRS